MCRRGKIGEARCLSGKPGPRLGEMTEISEMIAQVLVAGAHRLGIWRAARAVAAVDLLLDQIGGDLIVGLAVGPVHHPARLGAGPGVAGGGGEASGRRSPAPYGLVEVFRDGVK